MMNRALGRVNVNAPTQTIAKRGLANGHRDRNLLLFGERKNGAIIQFDFSFLDLREHYSI
jgi:hypothetical protein